MQKNIIILKQRFLVTSVIAILVAGFLAAPLVRADRFDDQIKQLNEKNNQNQASVSQLNIQAESYQAEINRLQSEINGVRSQIAANEQKYNDLLSQIKVAEDDLARQKVLLAANIKAIYVEGQISTLEMLASSKDISEFLDKQQYRDIIQNKIKDSLDKINTLKAQLKDQKTEVEQLLENQRLMNSRLTNSQFEQSKLLSYTQAQKDQYEADIQANKSNIATLRQQQIAENARLFARTGGIRNVPDSSGYPWASYRSGSWTHGGSCYYGDDVDPWGLCYRQCVSYVAWKIYKTKGNMPYGYGDAKNWDDRAEADGIPVDGNPQVGDVAVSNNGTWGHVMYVESVNNGNGTINVSQYNIGLTGTYSEATVYSSGLRFIHF